MDIWTWIENNNMIIILVFVAFVIGVVASSRLNGIKTIVIKNPFASAKGIIEDKTDDDSPQAMRFKREYVINLIVKDEKDFPYNDVSKFTIGLEDIIAQGRLEEFLQTSQKDSKQLRKEKDKKEEEVELTEEMFEMEDYEKII